MKYRMLTALVAASVFGLSTEAIAQTGCDGSWMGELSCDVACDDGCDSIGVLCRDGERGCEGITGNWFGWRPLLNESGITGEADIIQFYQGVAAGGVEQRFRYAGHGDYAVRADFGKMCDLDGWSLLVRAEHRWGQLLARDAGVLLPPALHAATPTLETEELLITNVLFTGVVHENLTVFFGKLDTLDGDRNPFASGRGKTQFLNTSLLLPVIGLPTVPLATLGAGAALMVDGLPLAQFMVLNATDTVESSGFSELFAEGALLLGSVNVPLPIAGKMGIHTFTAGWSSRTFTSLDQDPRIILPNVPLQETDGSWLAWWSGAQYLVQDKRDPMKGWGLFGRAGASDGEVNPIEYFFNAGIGGQSPIRGRENDLFGVGWFYNRYSDDLGPVVEALLDLGNSSSGVEMYYNYAATPYLRITPDLQVLEPGSNRADTALVLGLRAEVDF